VSDFEQHLGEATVYGYALPRPAGGNGILGTVRVLEQATPERLRIIRKYLPEIAAEELTKTGARSFVDRDAARVADPPWLRRLVPARARRSVRRAR
jgi:hypothetical protein